MPGNSLKNELQLIEPKERENKMLTIGYAHYRTDYDAIEVLVEDKDGSIVLLEENDEIEVWYGGWNKGLLKKDENNGWYLSTAPRIPLMNKATFKIRLYIK